LGRNHISGGYVHVRGSYVWFLGLFPASRDLASTNLAFTGNDWAMKDPMGHAEAHMKER
jgi:hypothetical protein